jgi:hypothetical protein
MARDRIKIDAWIAIKKLDQIRAEGMTAALFHGSRLRRAFRSAARAAKRHFERRFRAEPTFTSCQSAISVDDNS